MSTKTLLKGTSLVLGLLSLIVMQAPVAKAQITGSGSAGSAIAVPGYTAMPIQDWDRSNDEIVQINNLTIQSVQGNMIYASRETVSSCTGYLSAQSSGHMIPCPQMAWNALYQLSVQNDTILLLKNRQRASLSDFEAGDKVNVFGFLDSSSQLMQALILRDLDKPALQGAQYYTQFNSVRTVSAPANYLPTSFDVVFGGMPCRMYSSASGYPTGAACPFVMSGTPNIYMPAKHTVNVTNQTVILNQYRQQVSLATIQAGDTLNIFGRYNPQTGTIDALIIRDLYSGGGTIGIPTQLSVTVVDNQIVCIKAPCGLFSGTKVVISGANGYQSSAVTDSNGTAQFSGIPTGWYSITAYSADGRTGSGSVQVTEVNNVTVFINGSFTKGNLQVTAPNGYETLNRSTSYQIRWGIPSVASGQMSAGNSFDINLIHKTIGSDYIGNVQYPIARSIFTDFGMTTGTYQWTVGNAQSNVQDGGNYYIQVCYAGTYTCDESDAPFTITSSQSSGVQAYSLSPQGGAIGTTVTVSGNGFVAYGNEVHLEGQNGLSAYLPNISSNGTSLVFTVPSYTSYACEYTTPRCGIADQQLTPGIYNVWIKNVNGFSNKLQFNLTDTVYSQGSTLSYLSPQQGTIGTVVTIVGSGFTPGDNRVIMGSYQAASVSSNGTSLTFTVPQYLGANCAPNQACPLYAVQVQPGYYPIHIENANGTSNNLNFQVYSS